MIQSPFHNFGCVRKIPIILFILFYSAGTLLCPMGDFSCTKNIAQEYNQCKGEDADIDAFDFVFEHLLNLESLFDQFETKTPEEKNDKPHQPFQQIQSLSQMPVVVSKHLHIESGPAYVASYQRAVYPLCKDDLIPSGFLTEVFHPPSV